MIVGSNGRTLVDHPVTSTSGIFCGFKVYIVQLYTVHARPSQLFVHYLIQNDQLLHIGHQKRAGEHINARNLLFVVKAQATKVHGKILVFDHPDLRLPGAPRPVLQNILTTNSFSNLHRHHVHCPAISRKWTK